MPKIIISISGKKGAGKDTCANIMLNYFKKNYPKLKVKKLSFAFPLKEFIKEQFGFSEDDIDFYKNIDNYKVVNDKTMRKLLQDTGMALRKVFGDDFFTKIIKDKIKKNKYDIVIIPDLRFKIEYISLLNEYKNYAYYAIAIDRETSNNNNNQKDIHISEREWETFVYDFWIKNKELKNFSKDCIKILEQILKENNEQ